MAGRRGKETEAERKGGEIERETGRSAKDKRGKKQRAGIQK